MQTAIPVSLLIKNRWDFHGKGCFPSLFHGIVYLCCGRTGQIKILDLDNALHIFQHFRNQTFVSVAFPLSKGLLCPLHSSVDGEEQHQSRQCNQPIRQSKRRSMTAMMPEVRKPLVVTMTTRVAMLAMFSMVLVVTAVTSPRLLSLNQLIGR